MDKDELKNLLRRYNLKPNFTYGQNFLIDDFILEKIVNVAEVAPQDVILEIGPGIGNLTRLLCERAGFVLSVEKDPKFLPVLRNLKKNNKNLRFEIADILEFNFYDFLRSVPIHRRSEFSTDRQATQQESFKVVANIPYYITGKILKLFLTAKHKPSSITILTQKEVAENLSAKAGSLSILGISAQLFGDVKLKQIVPAKSFYPAPKVDSAIIRIDIPKKPKYYIKDEAKLFKIIKACFAGKRKQIHNTLTNNLHLDKLQVLDILASLKIKPASRPQQLTIENWISLHEIIP